MLFLGLLLKIKEKVKRNGCDTTSAFDFSRRLIVVQEFIAVPSVLSDLLVSRFCRETHHFEGNQSHDEVQKSHGKQIDKPMEYTFREYFHFCLEIHSSRAYLSFNNYMNIIL